MAAQRVRAGLFSTLLAGALACGVAGAAVETPQFRIYGPADGLPSDSVYALEPDRDGALWIGTADGLARFDGVEFGVFRHAPREPASLPSNVVQALHVDATGQVWVGSEGGGLSRLRSDGGFDHFRRDTLAGLELDDVWAITSTADGALWFGGFGGGLYRLAPDGALRGFRHAPDDPHSLSSDHVLALAVDAAGALWIAGGNGLDRWTGERFERHPAGAGGPSAGLIFSLSAEPDGGLWLGTAAGLDHRAPDGTITAAPQRAGLSEPGVTALLRDGPDSLWIATRSGLHHWQHGAQRPLVEPMRRQGIDPGAVLDIAADHEGGLWFATLGEGLLRLPPNWRDFGVLRTARGQPDTPSSTVPRAAAASRDGRLWVVGSGGGLDRVNPSDGRVERLLTDDGALPDRRLASVVETADGAVWIGHQLGLSRHDPASGSTRHWLASAADGPPAGAVDLLVDDGAGGFWLSAYGGGIERRSADGTRLERHLPGDGDFATADTEQLLRAPDGMLWVAGASGLLRRDPASGKLRRVDGGPDGRVHGLLFEAADTLWTHRLGALERWRFDGERLQLGFAADADAGLPAVEAGALLQDTGGALWLTSRRGLWRFRPDTGEFRHYGVRDGLVNQEFLDRPALLTASGLVAAGTLDGLVLFEPAALHTHYRPPALRVQSASVLRDGVRFPLNPARPLQLMHGDRELQVVARLATFAAPDARRHRFRLAGFDDGWIDTGALDERRYSWLPPGSYRLEIDGAGPEGGFSGTPLVLPVEVAPPWWRTGPAYAGSAALLLLALAGGSRLQQRRLGRRQAQALAERQRQWALQASEAKTRFLATLGHEIRTPMTGVLGMTELLLGDPLDPRQRHRAEAIQRSGELMLRLLNDALDLARIEAGRLTLLDEPFDLVALLQEVGEQQAALAARKGLRFALSIDPAVARWRLGDRLRLRQVLLNLGGNAIKFTEQGHVALRLLPADDGFELQVADSGPGLGAEQVARLFQRFEQADPAVTAARYGGSGLGLAISQELVAAMGGRIDVDSDPGVGSTFRVWLALPVIDRRDGSSMISASASSTGDAVYGAQPAAAAAGSIAQGSLRLLLVEDDATVAEVIAGLLAARGHQVAHVPHGLAALSELERKAFDLALLDLDLPGVDGLALAGLLRHRQPDLSLIALTARSDADAEPAARTAGFDAFVRKPVDGTTLDQLVRQVREGTRRGSPA